MGQKIGKSSILKYINFNLTNIYLFSSYQMAIFTKTEIDFIINLPHLIYQIAGHGYADFPNFRYLCHTYL